VDLLSLGESGIELLLRGTKHIHNYSEKMRIDRTYIHTHIYMNYQNNPLTETLEVDRIRLKTQ